MIPLAIGIFSLTWLLIASRRMALLPLGRPAGALLGAVLMVSLGVLSPHEAYAAIDHDTIVLLFGMMLLGAYLVEGATGDAVIDALAQRVFTPWRLLVALSLLAAAASALLVNDTVCVILAPLIAAICHRRRLPPGPYLVALATSANIGSAATLVGNPQNMLIGSMSGIPFASFLLRSAPATLAALSVNLILLRVYFRHRLPATLEATAPPEGPPTGWSLRPSLPLLVAAALAVAFLAGLHMGFATLAGVLVIMIARHTDPAPTFARVDWPLLVFFAALFIVVGGLHQAGATAWLLEHLGTALALDTWRGVSRFSLAMLVGSNVLSNVPMVMLTGPTLEGLSTGTQGWLLLAFTTTLAGNFTLVGSVANLIVAERSRAHYSLGFWEYFRFGAISTMACLVVGVPILVLTCRWLG